MPHIIHPLQFDCINQCIYQTASLPLELLRWKIGYEKYFSSCNLTTEKNMNYISPYVHGTEENNGINEK